MKNERIALVTGGNRGIGFEVCRQLAKKGLTVILTARSEKAGQQAIERLSREGLGDRLEFHELDVTDPKSIGRLHEWVASRHKRLDVLVNNAGILIDSAGQSALKGKVEDIRKTMETNVYGPFQLIQAFLPMMNSQHYGRVVNLSSGMGELTDMEGGWPAYRISKTSINAVTRIFAAEAGENVLVNSVCPGWVKTDMGGAGAERSPEEGADTVVWLATLPDGGPSGGFFRDRERIPW